MSSRSEPSSANNGFFQNAPVVLNQFHDDVSFGRVVKLFLPPTINKQISPDLENFGQEVLSKRVFDWVTDAERNVPYLKGGGKDAFGRRTSDLVVGEGWRELQDFGISHGIVAAGYQKQYGEYSRVVQYMKAHLWTGSCANVTCPSAMTDGAAKLLSGHLSSDSLDPATRPAFRDAYDRLTSIDPKYAWTSGQWMTERSGGSDVSKTETIAIYSPNKDSSSALGPWSIDGFKWFSSATDSNMAILLAQSPKGLSTFFAPMRLPASTSTSAQDGGLNGIQISRLKSKFGTKSLPTAELELVNTRAHLIGSEGQGIREISTILNISRLWSAVSAVGYLGRGIGIVKAWAGVREVGKQRAPLKENGLFMSTISKVVGEYHEMMLFTFFVAYLVGLDEQNSPSPSASKLRPESATDVSLLLRILTPLLKATVCKRSIHNLQECMEALGGLGYLDNAENESINVARLYRDCCVLSIWEGTTDVLSSDSVRVLKGTRGKEVVSALERWIDRCLRGGKSGDHRTNGKKKAAWLAWESVRDLLQVVTVEELLPKARELVFKIAHIVTAVLLVVDAESDDDLAVEEILSRSLRGSGILGDEVSSRKAREELALNQRIVYGFPFEMGKPNGSKL